jgi:hypothetical protein
VTHWRAKGKVMFKIFWKIPVPPRNHGERDWRLDPSGHPDLLAMKPRELADLPMVAEVTLEGSCAEYHEGRRWRATAQ